MQAQSDEPHLPEQEEEFSRRWRELVDEAGGQSRVVNRLQWSKSTTSRDYRGETLPTNARIRQLCVFLGLEQAEEEKVLRLLTQARLASRRRKRGLGPGLAAGASVLGGRAGVTASASAPVPVPAGAPLDKDSPPVQAPDGQAMPRDYRWRAALGSAALAALIAIVALAVSRQPAHPPGSGPRAAAAPVVRGTYAGLGLKSFPLKDGSLTPALAAALRMGKTPGKAAVDGYAFRNMKNPGLCLTAEDTGPAAGENRDRVNIEECDYAPNQIWVPEQWEAEGSRFTQLVSLRYQSKCLNAQYIGGLANGHKTMLWNCYPSPNESWDFGDWFASVKSRGQAYPIFVQSARFCLDADKYDFGDGGQGAQVNIWNQYPAANQFWS